MEQLVVAMRRSTHTFTYLAVAHAALITMALAVTVIWDQPGALVLAAPSLVIVTAAALGDRLSAPGVTVLVDRPRALEGDVVMVRVSLHSPTDQPLVDVELAPDRSLDHVGSMRALTSMRARTVNEVDFRVVVEPWGVVPLGYLSVRVRDRFGLVAITTWYQIVTPLRVHIHEEAANRLTEPDRFRRLVGSHTSAERGDGCEIADVRPYQPGDRLQALNWRISARNDEPWITLRHPDRSTTVVVLLDAYQRLGLQSADGLRRSIRATLGLARLHIENQDPVGMMLVGDGARWFPPDLGRLHLHRLTDALLELSSPRWSDGLESAQHVPRRIPKDAIVLAVSPLVDQRFVELLTSLRARGHAVHVVEPLTHWPRHALATRGRRPFLPEMAWRIYSLEQQAVRSRLTRTGATVIPWADDQPIDAALAALSMARRAQRIGVGR